MFGDGANPAVFLSSGITEPSGIFVTYEDAERVSSATARLRSAFPITPIFARAQTRSEAQYLQSIGATEVVIEADELPRSASAFAWSTKLWPTSSINLRSVDDPFGQKRLKRVASFAAGLPLEITNRLFELFISMDQDMSGQISQDELANLVSKTNAGLHSDDELQEMVASIRTNVTGPLDILGFCRFYGKASPLIKEALTNAYTRQAD